MDYCTCAFSLSSGYDTVILARRDMIANIGSAYHYDLYIGLLFNYIREKYLPDNENVIAPSS
jgi:hypothetical protein